MANKNSRNKTKSDGGAKEPVRVIASQDVNMMAEALGALGEVWAPVQVEEGFWNFKALEPGDTADFSGIQTLLSAKHPVFPPEETLVTFEHPAVSADEAMALTEPPKIIEHLDKMKRVLLGAHPCDLAGMKALDEAMRDGVTDPNYFSRRNNLTVIAVECLKPCWKHAFCSSMGTYQAANYDLLMQPVPGGYALKAANGLGEAVIAAAGSLLHEATEEDAQALAGRDEEIEAAFSERKLDLATLPDDMGAAHASPIWQTMAERCLDCGQCVFVCPTCYCFDVEDRVAIDMKSSARTRKWDGCMLRPFAEVAGGENFRGQTAARIRHRMYRKGCYLDLRHGMPFCVGCGRCVATCPVEISVLKVFEAAQGRRTDV